MEKRMNLVKFRGGMALTQEQMADRIGVKRQYYSQIEVGKRRGNLEFWNKLQAAFELDGAIMWQLMQTEEV